MRRACLAPGGANETDDSRALFLVAPAKAGVQSRRRGAGRPGSSQSLPLAQPGGKLWVPAVAGMTKKEIGTKC